jgi:hypothetical protein
MSEEQQPKTSSSEEMTDEEAILKIASAMKDTPTSQDEKQNVYTFLTNVIQVNDIDKVTKLGNLKDDKEINELGLPQWNLRGTLGMARISSMLMNNKFYSDYFEKQAWETSSSSLSREGFVIRQATISTKQVVDATRRRKVNRGMFGRKTIEESGGDIIDQNRPIEN